MLTGGGGPMDWHSTIETITPILDTAEKLTKIAAVLVGGTWAYVKFFRGRTFRPRIELKVSGKFIKKDALTYLLILAELKNVGLSKIKIKQQGSAIVVSSFRWPEEPACKVEKVRYEPAKAFEVFKSHAWVEPGEPIEDQCLVLLPDNPSVLRLDLRIVCKFLFGNIEVNIPGVVEQVSVGQAP
jgi:hypothetical protein